MKKTILLYLILAISFLAQAQEKINKRTYVPGKKEISYTLKIDANGKKTMEKADSGYKLIDTLPVILARILYMHPSQLRFSKTPPQNLIYFDLFIDGFNTFEKFQELTISELRKYFKFTIRNKQDSIDVLVLKIADENKLKQAGDNILLRLRNKTLQKKLLIPRDIVDYFQKKSGMKVLNEIDDGVRYVLLDVTENQLTDINTFNEYALKEYGIHIVREKRLLPIKYVEFHDFDDYLPLNRVEIHYRFAIDPDNKKTMEKSNRTGRSFIDTLPALLTKLFAIHPTQLQFSRTPPNNLIHLEQDCIGCENDNYKALGKLYDLTLPEIRKRFECTIYDKEDSLNVLVVKALDKSKLKRWSGLQDYYVKFKDRNGIPKINLILNHMVQDFQHKYGIIAINEVDVRGEDLIFLDVIENYLDDIDKFNEYTLKEHGVYIVREKRLFPIKYVEFHDY